MTPKFRAPEYSDAMSFMASHTGLTVLELLALADELQAELDREAMEECLEPRELGLDELSRFAKYSAEQKQITAACAAN